eukprot:9322280-Pyramimonas_sp.AAC.1
MAPAGTTSEAGVHLVNEVYDSWNAKNRVPVSALLMAKSYGKKRFGNKKQTPIGSILNRLLEQLEDLPVREGPFPKILACRRHIPPGSQSAGSPRRTE